MDRNHFFFFFAFKNEQLETNREISNSLVDYNRKLIILGDKLDVLCDNTIVDHISKLVLQADKLNLLYNNFYAYPTIEVKRKLQSWIATKEDLQVIEEKKYPMTLQI